MKGQKCITNRLIFANRWVSIDVILQELPPVCGHVVANVHDFSTSNEILIQKYTGKGTTLYHCRVATFRI